MKRLSALLLSLLLLLALAACGTPTVESPSPDPSPALSENVTTDSPVPTIALPEDVRYFFADGYFLAAGPGGQWRSASEGGFTLGELFGRDYPGHLGRLPLGGALFRCLGQQTVYRGRHTTASALWSHRGARLH